jgi:hypothetical protein
MEGPSHSKKAAGVGRFQHTMANPTNKKSDVGLGSLVEMPLAWPSALAAKAAG